MPGVKEVPAGGMRRALGAALRGVMERGEKWKAESEKGEGGVRWFGPRSRGIGVSWRA